MNFLLPAAAFGLGAGYLALIARMPAPAAEDPVGPKLFPTLIALGILGCSVFLWREARAASAPTTVSPADGSLRRRQLVAIGGVAAGTLIYVVALEPVGYLASSFVFMLGLLLAFNRGRPAVNVLIAAGFSSALYFGLKGLLGVSLPDGVLAALLR